MCNSNSNTKLETSIHQDSHSTNSSTTAGMQQQLSLPAWQHLFWLLLLHSLLLCHP
jgi:hypothetical protein